MHKLALIKIVIFQIRVVIADCPVGENFRHVYSVCYPEYSADVEDKGNKDRNWHDFPVAENKSADEVKDA